MSLQDYLPRGPDGAVDISALLDAHRWPPGAQVDSPLPLDREALLQHAVRIGLVFAAERGCGWCGSSRRLRNGLCDGCRTVLRDTRAPIRHLEFIAHARVSDPLYTRLANWKALGGARLAAGCHHIGEPGLLPAVLLSAYLEAHWRTHLENADVTVVVVPTRNPVIARALEIARELGWYSPSVRSAGPPPAESQHERTYREKHRRQASDFTLVEDVAGPVLLLDDIYTSGYTMHAFARQLRNHGATAVYAVALLRCGSWRSRTGIVPDASNTWSVYRSTYAQLTYGGLVVQTTCNENGHVSLVSSRRVCDHVPGFHSSR